MFFPRRQNVGPVLAEPVRKRTETAHLAVFDHLKLPSPHRNTGTNVPKRPGWSAPVGCEALSWPVPTCPAWAPLQKSPFPQQATTSPLTHTGEGPPAPTSLGKYLLLAPRSDGMRLVKPRGLVGWDLIVGPRAPGAARRRILDSSRAVILRGAGHLDGRLAVI